MLDMKKIVVFGAFMLALSAAAVAQKEVKVAEKDVEVNYVRDFQNQVSGATSVAWWKISDNTYKVTYADEEKSRQAMVFSPKGSETHYYIDRKYTPLAVRDTVSHLYGGFSIEKVWVRKARGKMTYQASIVKKSGFLWWKKVVESKTLNFEVDGKFINAE